MSLYTPKAVYAASERQYTAAGEVQVPGGGIYEWRKAERQEIDTQIGKANAVLRELCRSVVRLRPGQETSLGLPYFNLRYFGSKCIALKKKLCCDFSAPGHWAPLVTPWCDTSRQSPQLWNSQSPEYRTTSNCENTTEVSSAMYPECPKKDCWGKPCRLNPRESDPDAVQGLGGVTASPTLLGPILVWSQQNYLKLLLTVRYSKFSYGCCPRNAPLRKSGHENEWNEYLRYFIFTGV